MLVVSDAGPVRYLTLIGHIEKLHVLYGDVAIPEGVARELSHPNTPESVRLFVATPPVWLSVRKVLGSDPQLDLLGLGEREAIFLAGQLQADLFLCDDLLARKLAIARNLRVIGTLGVLRDAATRHLLDISAALRQLRTQTNFRASEDLYAKLLEEVRREIGQSPTPRSRRARPPNETREKGDFE